ncbi:MAG: tail fiber domain-containing protein [Caulobacteraceae bacterium]|nr:tail fiber domain-containing protein [Caulobacteraceae bacterium]
MNAMNQAMQQQQGMNQNYANYQNQLRQQAIAEQMQRRGMSLNEMNALLSGQQVAMPQMPSFVSSGRAETPNILGATQMGYDAQLGAYNAQQAGLGNLLGAGAQLGAAYLMGPAAGAAPFAFSDRRLKRNIRRVGTHAIGVGIYDYTMMGMPQRGVIAQEVQQVRPDLVKRHANGE